MLLKQLNPRQAGAAASCMLGPAQALVHAHRTPFAGLACSMYSGRGHIPLSLRTPSALLASTGGVRGFGASPSNEPGATAPPAFGGRGSCGLYAAKTRLATADTERMRVAVDIDEVLGRFLHSLNRYYLERYGKQYTTDDFLVYEFAKVWNCTQDKSSEIVYEFFQHPLFKEEGIPVIPGAFESLQRLGKSFDLVVVTSRQHAIQSVTLDWIDRHYPGIFQEVYFGNHWAVEGTPRKKSDICRAIGASVIIDDNVGYAVDCANAGIQVLLYDWESRYPWSKIPVDKRHPLITVVNSWSEVEEKLRVLAPELAASINTA